MKIYYDNIIFSLQNIGGISIYWKALIEGPKQYEIFCYGLRNENYLAKEVNIKTEIEAHLHPQLLRYLPFTKRLSPQSIFHSSYYRISLQKDIVNITTVHDFSYQYFKQYLPKSIIHNWQKYFAIKNSDGIICISENTKKDLLRYYPQIPEAKIKVIYNGVSDSFKILANPSQDLAKNFSVLKNKSYLLYVGKRGDYKNFDYAIEVIKKFSHLTLVIVGGEVLGETDKKRLREQQIIHLQYVSEAQLNVLYNNAFCLLYPSTHEGFGFPLVEAMKAGCPVISVNASAITEVVGDGGLLTTKPCIREFSAAMEKIENHAFRKALIEKGLRQSKKFSWDKCILETNKFYQTIWQRRFARQ